MAVNQTLFSLIFKKSLFIFSVSLLLAACSSEEDLVGAQADTVLETGASSTIETSQSPEPDTLPQPVTPDPDTPPPVNLPPPPPPPVPVVSLSASAASIDQGQSVTLSWNASNASSCTALAGWGGTRAVTGSQAVRPVVTSTYTLTCSGAGGSASDTVVVAVTEPPPPVPVVSLSASAASIDQGQSVTLSWNASNAASCTASADWGGTRAVTGSQVVSPAATSTYTLTCSGAGGSASDSVVVTVNAPPLVQDLTLSWIAPVEREDGTPISMAEIAGYRVYYGTSPGSYTNQVDVQGGSTMQVTLTNLTKGAYYIVVTTYDSDGRESAYSQEVVKIL